MIFNTRPSEIRKIYTNNFDIDIVENFTRVLIYSQVLIFLFSSIKY